MTENTTRRRLLAGAGAVLTGSLAGCSGLTPFVGKREEYAETYDAPDSLAVACETGEVVVRSADREDVEVRAVEKSSSLNADLAALSLEPERSGGRLTLRSVYTGETGVFSGRPSMDLTVTVPRTTAVERIETTTGSVEVRDTTGDLDVAVETGSVDVESVAGTVAAASETGSVAVADTDAIGDVTTTTGSVEVEVNAVDGDTVIEAETGGIDATVGPGLNAELRASVETGSLTVGDIGLENATREENRVSGTLGEGGPTLRIESETGSVRVSPRG